MCQNLGRDMTALTDVFRDFSQYLQVSVRIVPQIRPQLLDFMLLSMNYNVYNESTLCE